MKTIRTYPVEREATIEMPGVVDFLSIKPSTVTPDIWCLSAVVNPEGPLELVRITSYVDNEEFTIFTPEWTYVGTDQDKGIHFFASVLVRR